MRKGLIIIKYDEENRIVVSLNGGEEVVLTPTEAEHVAFALLDALKDEWPD